MIDLNHHPMPTVVAALLAATALVACSPADNGTNGAAPVTSESATTATSTSGRSPDPTTPPSTPDCTSGDLAASEFGPHLRTASIRTSSAEYFHFDVRENTYDSCRDLSWVLLDGTIGDINGDHSRPAGTVVLFAGDRFVSNYQPPLYAGVDNVRRLADNAALITWRHNQAPRTSEESYELLDDHLRLVAYSTPDELRGAVPVIDFRNPPLDSQAGLPPEGNAHGSPYAAELPTGRYLLPLNSEQTLQCELGRDDGVIADCWANFQAHWDGDGSNHVRYVISPARIEKDINIAPDARGLPTLPRGDIYRVGTAVVDLQEPNVARIGLEPGQGVHISPGYVGEW
ncbi:hypothetical protein B842_00515 [Corynebacterium humireducens NBRC 106098 = DSM 45392]|uniref:Secreted protein n=1 Tax=Corynebacterium humireducens NBRC 106098 = DSM 45392 TaxID=1223515 RepID=A0A0B5D6K9_9CORY|nr:hypothetical protein B842_00515 [Corynebacterium humireducens NBRC 106098 = DSM 45392]